MLKTQAGFGVHVLPTDVFIHLGNTVVRQITFEYVVRVLEVLESAWRCPLPPHRFHDGQYGAVNVLIFQYNHPPTNISVNAFLVRMIIQKMVSVLFRC